MAITVKHTKVSTIPDGDDSSLIRPSDWNADHTLVGLGTMAEQNANNVNITGGTISGASVSGYIPTTQKGVANGVATLDSGGQIPLSQIPPLGDLNYQGSWNASTNTPTLTSSVGTKGYYYVVSVAGTTNLNGITDWQIGDWAVFNGSVWQKIDNTDAVTSVNGYTGTVVLTQPDIAGTVPTSRTISTGTGLTGGGDLSANRTISFSNNNVATWAATPSSANLAAAVTDETGSGSLVFGTNPTLANPNIDVVDFDTTYATTLTAGQLGWDGNNTLGLGMAGGNVIQHIGEDSFIYCKASSTITKGQVIMFTGAVGASAVVTGAPATGITDGTYIMGIAAENIATNAFGLVQCFGTLRNVNTTGYADGDILWYNPAVTGGLTKTTPSAPNVKVQMAAVLNGGSSGGGSILIRVNAGSALGGTDSNVQITSVANGNLLTYDGGNGYWKNTDLTAGTGISVTKSANGVLTVTNTSPSSGGTVTSVSTGTGLTGGPITTSGTISLANTTVSAGSYTNASITVDAQGRLTSASSGTAPVTSVTGTSPVVSSGGTTPAISLASGYGDTQNPYASKTANYVLAAPNGSAGAPTFRALVSADIPALSYVSSVSGTTGRITSTGGTTPVIDLASGVATPSTTGSSTLIPVITIDTYGRVTSVTTASNPQGTVTSVGGTGTVSGITLSGTVTSSGSLTLGGTLDLSAPPAIGGTTPNAITGTTITATKYVGISGGTF